MLIKDIMTTNIETATPSQTLDDIVETMFENEINHVVVVENDTPAAIVTRRKVLIATYKTDAPLSEIPVSGFGRGLGTTISPNTTVLLAVGKVQKLKADCVPVVDGMEVMGVLTQDDIINNVSKITDEMLEHNQRGEEWTYES